MKRGVKKTRVIMVKFVGGVGWGTMLRILPDTSIMHLGLFDMNKL